MDNKNLITESASDHLLHYFSEKWKIPQKDLYIVDWLSFQMAINKLKEREFLQISKLSSNWLLNNTHKNWEPYK